MKPRIGIRSTIDGQRDGAEAAKCLTYRAPPLEYPNIEKIQ